MKPLAVLRNDARVPPGYLAQALERAGATWELVRLDAGDPLPQVDAIAGVVALGGLMGACDGARYPHLEDEKGFLVAAIDADVPVLGICLGSHLLAAALGGGAYLAETPEAVHEPVDLTEAGAADAVLATLAGRPVLRLHQDTWDPPPGATTLARGGGFEQAFRFGSALGIQPHPEVDPEIVAGWLSRDAVRDLVTAAGSDPDDLVWKIAGAREDGAETAARFFDAWLAGL
jgi:GMP synthase (glutamine-hydrolysing)